MLRRRRSSTGTVPGRRSSTLSISSSSSPPTSDDDDTTTDHLINDDDNINITPRKLVGIIGSGVSGLAAAKAFSSQGHDVVIFERLPSIGGVWHSSRSYPGIETQSPKDLYRFSDMGFPEDCQEWPSGQDVVNYLQSYAEKHNLMQYIRFGSTVLSMEERYDETKGNNIGWVLQIKSDNETEAYEMEFDYVCVCSGTFTNKKTLYHPGQDDFLKMGGIIKHSSEYKDISDDELKGKDVVVIGGSKSATDVAVHAAMERGANEVTLVMRRNVWRVPRFIGGYINFKHVLYMRAQEIQFTSWKVSSALSLLLWYITMPLVYVNFIMLELLLIVQLGLKKYNMMPSTRIQNSVSCEIPIVTEGLIESIDSGDIVPINSTVKQYKSNKTLLLNNGTTIKADVVIQATGWTIDLPFLPDHVKDELIDQKDGLFRLYRFAVNPNIPNLGFVGYNSSFCTVLSSELIANWLVRYVDNQLVNQKTHTEMGQEIDRMLKWKREVYPAASVYSGNCIAPFHHLHFDEILDDIGATTRDTSMFSYPCAELYGRSLDSAPKYSVSSV